MFSAYFLIINTANCKVCFTYTHLLLTLDGLFGRTRLHETSFSTLLIP